MEIESFIKSQIESASKKMKNIYSVLINFIDAIDNIEDEFENLIITFKKQKILENKGEVILLSQLISKISDNHHRTSGFYDKLEKIFNYLIKDFDLSISNLILDYTNLNKTILFLLLEKKLIKPDEKFIEKYLFDKQQSFYYLYPKMKEFLLEKDQIQIEKEIFHKYEEGFSTFEEKCKNGENDSYICSLIRTDSVEDFIIYINQKNLSLFSTIKPSIYETNLFLIDKEPTLIEYASFFGSIQIIRYLKYNNVPLTFSMWLYAIHSNNAELIHFLEENNVQPGEKESFDNVLIESIKCHHNAVSNYIKDNLCEQTQNDDHFDDNFSDTIVNSLNFYFFPNKFESITSFGNKRFNIAQYHFLLTQIIIPPSVTSIGDGAFCECSSLTQISIPSSVSSFGDGAFYGCSFLKQITFETPSSVKKIGCYAFYGCSSLAQISIPSSVTSIGNVAFYGCSLLKQISFENPSSITLIGIYSFAECSSLTHISIPPSMISIGNYAFYGCTSLIQVSFEIQSSLISIGNYAFYGCSSLKKILIPSSTNKIGQDIFKDFSSLQQVSIPSSVISNKDSFNCSSSTQNISLINIFLEIFDGVSDEGEIGNEMSKKIFSSFNDQNIWSPFDIDCAMSNSSFYIARINSNLSLTNIDTPNDKKKDNVYLILRHTKDDITKYLDYLKFEYNSYIKMEEQVNKIIIPIGYTQNIPEEGFIFAFLTSTNLTLCNEIDSINQLPLGKRFAYIIQLIDNVDELSIEPKISGFYITPKTILINKEDGYMGYIGFIGEFDNLKLCSKAEQFFYNIEFSPNELQKTTKPTICAPNSTSDVYGLAKIVQLIIRDEIKISSYKNVMTLALQENPNCRISMNEFKNKIHEIQKEANLLENENPEQLIKQQIRLVDIIKEISIPIKTKEGYTQIYQLPSIITSTYPDKKLRKISVGPKINLLKDEIKILIVGSRNFDNTFFLNSFVNYLYGVEWEDNCLFKIELNEDGCSDITVYTFYWQPGFSVPYTVTLILTPEFHSINLSDEQSFHQLEFRYDQIKSLFNKENDYGIDSLNGVAFVIHSCGPRLCFYDYYIPESIIELFGKDIADNFFVIVTYADAGVPQILNELKRAMIPTNYVYKLTCWQLYSIRNGKEEKIQKLLCDIDKASYERIFTDIYKLSPKSLLLDQNIHENRVCIFNIFRRIKYPFESR